MKAVPRRRVGRCVRLLAAALALGSCDGLTGPANAPPTLADLQATPASHTEVLLTWAAPVVPVQHFELERATGTGGFARLATLAGDLATFRDTGLAPATVYRYRLRACSEGTCSDAVSVTATTLAALAITTQSLPDAVRGEPYSAGLNAAGGADGYRWTVLSGSPPAGLTVTELGIVSGIPQTAQVTVFVVRVQSEDGQTASREVTLRVTEPSAIPFAVEPPRLAPALAGSPYGVSLRTSGGDGGPVTWGLVSGTLPPGVQLSAGGVFSGSPAAAGTWTFEVQASGGGRTARRSYELRVVAHDRSRFNVTTFEVAVVPANIRPHVTAAVERWERVITGNLTELSIRQGFFSSTSCGGFGDLVNGTVTDDVILMVNIAPIDGVGRILGQAGPCGLRTGSRLPFTGVLTLDSDDLAPLVGSQTLTDLVFHEIGHVLGFGGLWGALSLLTGGGTGDPRFTGAQAMQQYAALGGSGGVPVENTGGAGTADMHWRESLFRTEIMTGFAEQRGVPMPLSRLTVAAMGDLGYTVNLAAADAYAPPGALPVPGLVPLEPLGWDVPLNEPLRLLPEGPAGAVTSPARGPLP